jgi:DNA recombination protein RmuC
MSSAVVAILTLVIGLLIGLALGNFIAGRRTSNDGVSAAEFASVRAERDLYKSERDNAMAGSKLATEIEAMKSAMEKLQKEASDADRRRIEAESDIRTQVKAMSNHNESLVAQTKAARFPIHRSAENLARPNSS